MGRNYCVCMGLLLLVSLSGFRSHTQTYTNEVSMTIEGDYRFIKANGIPEHATGRFPNRNNPNTIAPQSYAYRAPAKPRKASRTTALGLWPFGIALNGVPFDPGAAEFWNNDRSSGWQIEALSGAVDLGLDSSNGMFSRAALIITTVFRWD